jgi:hypothetical protein
LFVFVSLLSFEKSSALPGCCSLRGAGITDVCHHDWLQRLCL